MTIGTSRDPGVAHTGVHRLARRFLEPAQDVLGLALFALMARTIGVPDLEEICAIAGEGAFACDHR